jgi:hypothetical protein
MQESFAPPGTIDLHRLQRSPRWQLLEHVFSPGGRPTLVRPPGRPWLPDLRTWSELSRTAAGQNLVELLRSVAF